VMPVALELLTSEDATSKRCLVTQQYQICCALIDPLTGRGRVHDTSILPFSLKVGIAIASCENQFSQAAESDQALG
jgi:hypothetical protein